MKIRIWQFSVCPMYLKIIEIRALLLQSSSKQYIAEIPGDSKKGVEITTDNTF